MSSTQALPAESPWIPPGVIRLVRLKREGALGRGDLVATRRLGTCEVVSIASPHSLTVRALVRDRHAAARSAERVLRWPFERVVTAHNQVLDNHAYAQVKQALAVL